MTLRDKKRILYEQQHKYAHILENETRRELRIARSELTPRYEHAFELSTLQGLDKELI